MKPRRKMRPRAPRFTVEVTSELIADSKSRDSGHCMIAEAVKAAYPGATFVSVDLQTIRLTDQAKALRFTYLTPRQGQVALVNFDQGTLPEPFSFQLRGGQVTAAGARQRRPRQVAAAETDVSATTAKKASLAKATLSKQALVKGDGGNNVPRRAGGKTPPLAMHGDVPFARRRAFGLRALSR
jgi:hypothetical protein